MTAAYLENDLSDALPLNGEWEFRLADAPPILVQVPSAWETYTRDKTTDGPAFYRRAFTAPEHWAGKKITLEADAISFHATVRVNGQQAGMHSGMWSPFQIDLTPLVRADENVIEIEVWKPGQRFPLRECLAGFLPDVCTTFGGLWQPLRLRAFSRAALQDLKILTDASGRAEVHGRIAFLAEERVGEVSLVVRGENEQLLGRAAGQINHNDASFRVQVAVPDPARWEVGRRSPHYLLDVWLKAGGAVVAHVRRRVAFRDVAIADGKTLLNGRPQHVRGVLDWGWDPQRICPAPAAAKVRENFAKARALGFNLFKLCLFVPDEVAFDIADDEGVLLWLEMPIWLPRVTPEFRALALREYRDLFRRLHHHPSIAVLSLGCELNAESDADFLSALNALAREWFPNALICDNSGSAEAYGGVTTSISDFYDYHFYTDPHFFQPLVQHFSRVYRPDKPWIYGEFCDADTLRDFSRLEASPQAWWLSDPVPLDRDDFLHNRDYGQRLSAAGIADGGAALTRIARQQATAIRKFIVEQVRANSAAGGYVITGWADTPITSSGVIDDFGALKFAPDEWRQFNADRVLCIDRERRRKWTGGDRPARRDPFVWWQGERAEIHLLLSNGGDEIEHARLEWQLTTTAGNVVAEGAQESVNVGGGEVAEIAVLNAQMPQSAAGRPIELVLSAAVNPHPCPSPSGTAPTGEGAQSTIAHNRWRLWAAPRPRLPAIALAAPLLHRHNFARVDREVKVEDAASRSTPPVPRLPLVASELTDELLARVREGWHVLLWQQQPDARYTRSLPFWREAIHVFEPHPFWERVPHPGYADMRFFSVATDFAIDGPALANFLGPEAQCTSIWRRFDARALTWADYVIEVQYGAGRMFVATLRFEGGLGCQPDAFDHNPMGAWMLAGLLNAFESKSRMS